MNTRPLIIGHRGASALAPENTLASFKRAMIDRADGIEFDVRLSSDDVPMVIHDATLARTGRSKAKVASLKASELARVDVGSWFNHKYPSLAQSEFEAERVPSLARVFELFSDFDAVLYLEMKFEGSRSDLLARQCVETIRRHSFTQRTIVECFHLPALAEVKRLDSKIRTAALFEPSIKRPLPLLKRLAMIDRARDFGADEIAFHHRLASRRVVERANALGVPCVVWTVDKPRWRAKATDLGLRALITNNPAAFTKPILD
jgi:glycerophosphoryl diester phosphodiesterase